MFVKLKFNAKTDVNYSSKGNPVQDNRTVDVYSLRVVSRGPHIICLDHMSKINNTETLKFTCNSIIYICKSNSGDIYRNIGNGFIFGQQCNINLGT
jgi:hypothetical protein